MPDQTRTRWDLLEDVRFTARYLQLVILENASTEDQADALLDYLYAKEKVERLAVNGYRGNPL